MNEFKIVIDGWDSWSKIYQSIEVFQPIIEAICQRHHYNLEPIEHCQAGTNAVFRVGNKIIKIFAPKESGCDTTRDFDMELLGLSYANDKVPTTQVLAKGFIQNGYTFNYLVLSLINGEPLSLVMNQYSSTKKYQIGKQLRELTNQLNIPLSTLDVIDIIDRAKSSERWLQFPKSFQLELLNYLDNLELSSLVYVHGDLNSDNIIIDNNKLYIIDYADALMAPIEYEWALIISELFVFDKDYLKGYFGEMDLQQYIDICMKGLLIHDYGADIIRDRLGGIETITTLDKLQTILQMTLEKNFND